MGSEATPAVRPRSDSAHSSELHVSKFGDELSADEDDIQGKLLYEGLTEQDLLVDLGYGHWFGGRAMDDSKHQSIAHVLAKKATHLLVIKQQDYQHLKMSSIKRITAEQTNFLKGLQLMRTMSAANQKKAAGWMRIETKKINDYIYREGQVQTHVFIVKTGSLKVTTRLRGENANSELQAALAFQSTKKAKSAINPNFKKNQCATGHDTVELQILGVGEVCGEEDIIFSKAHTTSVQCIS